MSTSLHIQHHKIEWTFKICLKTLKSKQHLLFYQINFTPYRKAWFHKMIHVIILIQESLKHMPIRTTTLQTENLSTMKFAAILAIPAILANAASIGLQQQNANVSKNAS